MLFRSIPESLAGSSTICFQLSTSLASSTPSTTRWSALNVTSCKEPDQLSFAPRQLPSEETYHHQPRLHPQLARITTLNRHLLRILGVDVRRHDAHPSHRANRQLSRRRDDGMREPPSHDADVAQRNRSRSTVPLAKLGRRRRGRKVLEVGDLGGECEGRVGVDGGKEGREEASSRCGEGERDVVGSTREECGSCAGGEGAQEEGDRKSVV